VQDARLTQAALRYQQAVLVAGREVEDALVAFLQAQLQARHLEDSVREAARSVDLVLLQFKGGITDFNRVFNAQSLLVSQQDQLAATRGEIAIHLIEVYRALGGGWPHFLHGRCLPCRVPSLPRQDHASPPPPPEEVAPPKSVRASAKTGRQVKAVAQ
jgi:outer membrane protein TolC